MTTVDGLRYLLELTPPAERVASPVTLIAGPPCSGKTTAAAKMLTDDTLLVCWDTIAVSLGVSIHPTPYLLNARIQTEYEGRIAAIPRHPGPVIVIRTLADPVERATWAELLGASLLVLCPPRDVLLERVRARRRPSRVMASVDSWLALNAVSL